MMTRILGATELRVSDIGLGTAALGQPYAGRPPPSPQEAVDLVLYALAAGVNLIDTAPGYGPAEEIVGQALRASGGRHDPVLVTKVDPHGNLRESMRRSKTVFGRRPDVVLLHSPPVEVLTGSKILDALFDARRADVPFVGASVYSEQEALVAIGVGCDVIEVAYNLLDQRMGHRVLLMAAKAGVGVLLRSPFLRGVLTTAPEPFMPPSLRSLRTRARVWAAPMRLEDVALRFALSARASSVLVGVRTQDELREALSIASVPLEDRMRLKAREIAQTDDQLLNPARWGELGWASGRSRGPR